MKRQNIRPKLKLNPEWNIKSERKKYKVPELRMVGEGFLLREDFMIKIRRLYLMSYLFFQKKEYFNFGLIFCLFISKDNSHQQLTKKISR